MLALVTRVPSRSAEILPCETASLVFHLSMSLIPHQWSSWRLQPPRSQDCGLWSTSSVYSLASAELHMIVFPSGSPRFQRFLRDWSPGLYPAGHSVISSRPVAKSVVEVVFFLRSPSSVVNDDVSAFTIMLRKILPQDVTRALGDIVLEVRTVHHL